jgi:acyl carrier protein
MLAFVQAQVGKVLGLEVKAVQENTPLNEMGLDSLMAVELRNQLGKALALDRPLPVTLVFDYPTVQAIGEYLAKDVLNLESGSQAGAVSPGGQGVPAEGGPGMLETIEDLSDDDVDRLLAEMSKGKK